VKTERQWLNDPVSALLKRAENLPSAKSKFRYDLGRKQILLASAIARLYWPRLSVQTRAGIETMEAEEERPPHHPGESRGVQPDPENFENQLRRDMENAPDSEKSALVTLFAGAWQDLDFGHSRRTPTPFDPPAWRPLIYDIFGNPFRSVPFSPAWRTDTALSLARQMYNSREFSAMPILADALQDVGCDNEAILSHCRDTSPTHVRGCWVVDLVLGKS
jgi:hypothetical protein